MSRLGTIWIEGEEYDLDRLKLKEMQEIQRICQRPKTTASGEFVLLDGAPYMEPTPFSELEFYDADVQVALAFVIVRRRRPEFTLAEAGELELASFGEADEEVPDTGPPAEGVTENGQNSLTIESSGHLDSATPLPG
jgi:hypothetical protein